MMDDANPYAAPQEEPIDVPIASDKPQSVVEAMREGAWAGFKWATYIVGPVVVLMLVLGVGVVAFEWVLRGKLPGYFLLETLGGAVGAYATSCMWGVIIGIFAAVLRYLLRRRKAAIFNTR